MFLQRVCIVLCAAMLSAVRCGKEKDNNTSSTGRSPRYGLGDSSQPRTYYQDPYYDSNGLYPAFTDTRDRYGYQRPYPQEVPTGFDQFVPDKSSSAKYTYAPNDFYFADSRPDSSMQEVEEKNEVMKNPMGDLSVLSKLKDFVIRLMRYLFGNNDPDSILFDERPSLLSGLKSLLKDPSVALSVAIVPLSFLFANVVPYLAKMFMKASLGPVVTSTIANAVARSLDDSATVEIVKAIGELGSRAIEDPRCFQRFVCQTAKSYIESRSGDAWSAQKIIRKLATAVDGRLWEAMGLKFFFNSLQSGHCDSLPCNGGVPYSSSFPVGDKLSAVFSNFFNQTVTEVM